MAQDYWLSLTADEQFSAGFRQIAAQALQQLAALNTTISKMA